MRNAAWIGLLLVAGCDSTSLPPIDAGGRDASFLSDAGESDATLSDAPASDAPASDVGFDAPTSSPDVGVVSDAGASLDGGLAGPRRLTLEGRGFRDPEGHRVRLRGANIEGITAEEASDLHDVLGMNFVRMRVTFNDDPAVGPVTVDPDGHFLPDYLAQVDRWVDVLGAEGVWILVELRSEDHITNDPALYDTSSALFAHLEQGWLDLASRYRDADWIAGYGLLAEPSASRRMREPAATLTTFQLALMNAITTEGGDARTPFFVGTDYNYDAMQFRYETYWDALAAFHGRLVYEVNALFPKPWIQDGSVPAGVPLLDGVYPRLPAPADYEALITPLAGESFVVPRDLERIFSVRSEEPDNFWRMMNPGFARWMLSTAVAFRDRHEVPMLVDQFGASARASGNLAFEEDLLALFDELELHYSRWGYNAGSSDRRMGLRRGVPENVEVRALHARWIAEHP